MKRYRAIVIDGRKVVKHCVAAGIVLVISALALLNIKIADFGTEIRRNILDKERIVKESIPEMYGISESIGDNLFGRVLSKGLTFVLTFDPWDMRTVVFGEIPLIRQIGGGYLVRAAEEKMAVFNPKDADKGHGEPEPKTPENGEALPIKEVDSSQKKAMGTKSGKLLIRNETEYSINVDEMLGGALSFDMKGSEPKVLIVHTHGTESYASEGAVTYQSNQSDRSLDKGRNVVKVGEEMKKVFEEKGISVLHDTTLHDHPNFNGSYENSRQTVEMYLKKYPSISVVLDVHRDAFIYDDGSKAKFVTEIDGKKVAQLMLVVGSNSGGLEHPNWRENMKLALKFQSFVTQKYPSLMRGVNLRTERFNGHLTKGSMIIEVGSSGNTLSEAVEGARYGAGAMADFLNTLKE